MNQVFLVIGATRLTSTSMTTNLRRHANDPHMDT